MQLYDCNRTTPFTQVSPPFTQVQPPTVVSQEASHSQVTEFRSTNVEHPQLFPRPAQRVLLPSPASSSAFDLGGLRPIRDVDSHKVTHVCPLCGYRLVKFDSCCTHIRVSHLNHVIQCFTCEKLFKSADSAKKHFKLFH